MRALGLVVVLLSGCCFDGLLGASTPPVAPMPPASVTGGPHMPGGPGSAMFGRLEIAVGFTPDPTILTGRTGTGAPFSSFLGSCSGHGSTIPTHHLTVVGETAIFLRVMAYPPGGEDLTIAVRGSDGRVRCNDDFEGLMPLVEDTFAPGEYDVWVGTYSAAAGASVPFDLGVTTNLLVVPSNLHTPPPPGVPLAPGTLGTY